MGRARTRVRRRDYSRPCTLRRIDGAVSGDSPIRARSKLARSWRS
jgi:hypothetical protein